MLATVILRADEATVEVDDYDSFEVDIDSAIQLEEMIEEGLSFREALLASSQSPSGVNSVLNELLPYVTDDWEMLYNLMNVIDADIEDSDIGLVGASDVIRG